MKLSIGGGLLEALYRLRMVSHLLGIYLSRHLENYFSVSIYEAKETEFMDLIQGNATVLQYKAKFMKLMRYAPHVAGDEARKARKFQKGLHHNVRTKMASIGPRIFVEVVNMTMLIEQECEEVQQLRDQSKKH